MEEFLWKLTASLLIAALGSGVLGGIIAVWKLK